MSHFIVKLASFFFQAIHYHAKIGNRAPWSKYARRSFITVYIATQKSHV